MIQISLLAKTTRKLIGISSQWRDIYTPYVDVATYKWKLEIISFVAFFVIKVQLINKFSSFVEFVEYYYFLTKIKQKKDKCIYIYIYNAREHRRGNQILTIQRNWQHRERTMKKTNTK